LRSIRLKENIRIGRMPQCDSFNQFHRGNIARDLRYAMGVRLKENIRIERMPKHEYSAKG
jgi:hypothetical protein